MKMGQTDVGDCNCATGGTMGVTSASLIVIIVVGAVVGAIIVLLVYGMIAGRRRAI